MGIDMCCCWSGALALCSGTGVAKYDMVMVSKPSIAAQRAAPGREGSGQQSCAYAQLRGEALATIDSQQQRACGDGRRAARLVWAGVFSTDTARCWGGRQRWCPGEMRNGRGWAEGVHKTMNAARKSPSTCATRRCRNRSLAGRPGLDRSRHRMREQWGK